MSVRPIAQPAKRLSASLAAWRAPAALPLALAGALALVWLLIQLRPPDLAAQVYRSTLFIRDGLSVWDNHWYAGHHVPGYSLLFPPLADVFGARVLGAMAAVASAALFARLARDHFGAGARLGILWFAVATSADLLIGRLTYALGVAVGLGALLALQHRRGRLAALLSACCAAASPVTGLFLAMTGVGYALVGRRYRGGLALAAPALVIVGLLALAFPEGGRQPFPLNAFAAVFGSAMAIVLLAPGRERTLRVGAGLYAIAIVATLLVSTPMGGNVTRLGAAFSGPLLACALLGRRSGPAGRAGPEPAAGEEGSPAERDEAAGERLPAAARRLVGEETAADSWLGLRLPAAWRRRAVVLAFVGLVGFQWNGPIHEMVKGLGDPSIHADYYRPLLGFLSTHRTPVARVEVPFTLAHWETAILGPHVLLARGWERQLDTQYNPIFYKKGEINPSTYEAWLQANGVRYVALPDVALDPSSKLEGQLIRQGLPYLTPVWSSPHWRVFQFTAAQPMASGAGELTAVGFEDFRLNATRTGPIRVLIHFTPYWRITAGTGCVQHGPDDWTVVNATRTGHIHVVAGFNLLRVFDHGPRCKGPGGSTIGGQAAIATPG